LHKGRSVTMLRRAPSIAGMTLCQGWTDEATQALIKAVNQAGEYDRSCLLQYGAL
jgi:stress response protein SCP2